MANNSLLQGLNPQQEKAVVHAQGSLAVIAGAGSGKTSVLTKRIAWLVSTYGLRSYQILAVTFTNKAAAEMNKRLVALGIPAVDQMWAGTFHGLSHRLLRRHHEAAGLSAHFQILDAQEQEKVVKKVFKANDWSTEEFSPKDVVRYINAQKDEGRRPHQCTTENAIEAFQREAYEAYQSLCDQNSWVDFGELLLRCYEVTKNNEEIRLKYQTQFAHILVDEFQDTNDIQYNWIKLLSDAGQAVPVTVVGDMDQSIYSWRGAQMTNVQRFVDEFANVGMVKLEQNYRSTHHILACSNTIIQNNLQRIDKNLWTAKTEGDKVTLFEAQDEKEEAVWAVNQACRQHQKSHKWSDTAILYRSNAQSRIIEEACIKKNLPYKIYGGIRFFERTEVKDALSHLAVMVDINNDLMLERALATPTKGFGNKALEGLRTQTVARQRTWAQLLDTPEFAKEYLTNKAQTAWKTWKNLWEEQRDQGRLEDKVRWCVEQTGLLTHYEELDRKDKTDRAENLKELISVAKRYSQGKKESGTNIVLDFLASAALEAENASENGGDAIQLMTIHASKGLEFPTVCAIGWDEGLFPSSQSLADPQRLEEERRLAYVAITRAEAHLFVSGAVDRRQYGQVLRLTPSRFFSELPFASVQWARQPTRTGSLPKDTPKGAGASTTSLRRGGSSASFWNVGDGVLHPAFGKGKIIRVDGINRNDRVMVAFENGEKKILLPQLAKLEKA